MHLRNPSGEGSPDHPQLQQRSKRLGSQGEHIEAIGFFQAWIGLNNNSQPSKTNRNQTIKQLVDDILIQRSCPHQRKTAAA
jgi:hypothetical protein